MKLWIRRNAKLQTQSWELCLNMNLKTHLLNCEEMESVNHRSMAKFIDRSLSILWNDDSKYDKLLLLLTDGAPYIVKACDLIKEMHSEKLIHVTCLAHGLHRICETVRQEFKIVDELISNVKKMFLKSPKRVETFETIAPEVPLPPDPVVTRWGTWLLAAIYYAEHYDKIKEVIMSFNPNDASSIHNAQQCFINENENVLKNALTFINSNLHFLPKAINDLESNGMKLNDSVQIIETVKEKISLLRGIYGNIIKEKFSYIMKKNKGFQSVKMISKLINGENANEGFNETLTLNEISSFTYAPITNCDIERSFSKYKHLLEGRDNDWEFSNLKKVFISYCNTSKL